MIIMIMPCPRSSKACWSPWARWMSSPWSTLRPPGNFGALSTMIPMTDPWCCYIWCAMDPINISPMNVSINIPYMIWILWDTYKANLKADMARNDRMWCHFGWEDHGKSWEIILESLPSASFSLHTVNKPEPKTKTFNNGYPLAMST